jgi:hypothetical protein
MHGYSAIVQIGSIELRNNLRDGWRIDTIIGGVARMIRGGTVKYDPVNKTWVWYGKHHPSPPHPTNSPLDKHTVT